MKKTKKTRARKKYIPRGMSQLAERVDALCAAVDSALTFVEMLEHEEGRGFDFEDDDTEDTFRALCAAIRRASAMVSSDAKGKATR